MTSSFELKGDFGTEVLQSSHDSPILVDFWAEWCGPCRVLGPTLEKLAGEAEGSWRLVKVDTEAHPELAMKYGIQSIPAVKLFHGGEVLAEFVGALPEDQIRSWLEKELPADGATGGLLQEALEVLRTNPSQAMELVEELPEPDEVSEAVLTMGRLIDLSQREEDTQISGKTESVQKYLAAARAFAAGDEASAVNQWIALLESDRQLDEDGPRRACIAAFKLMGEENEITRELRRSFSAVLY